MAIETYRIESRRVMLTDEDNWHTRAQTFGTLKDAQSDRERLMREERAAGAIMHDFRIVKFTREVIAEDD